MAHATPANPQIYHITSIDNVVKMAKNGWLLSDARCIQSQVGPVNIGLSDIKKRRLEKEVDCHPSTKVGQYVPFYFCPRSVMLYLNHMRNGQLTNPQGQEPIVHLRADLHRVIEWADSQSVKWAISDCNASANLASFYNDILELRQINWSAVENDDFRSAVVKQGKQAEFMTYDVFPWNLIEEIGVIDAGRESSLNGILADVNYAPVVNVQRSWYF